MNKRKYRIPILAGRSVTLHPPNETNAEEFLRSASDSGEFHSGLVSPPLTREAFREYAARNNSEQNAAFLIVENAREGIAGAINLSQVFRGPFRSAYLGYYLFEGFTGRGLMSEALRLVVDFAFTEFELHRLEANIQPHNTASIRLVQNCGFIKEGFSRKYLCIDGEWRDHERWATIVEDQFETGSGQ